MIDVIAHEPLAVGDHRILRIDRVELPPRRERAHEDHAEHVRVTWPQAPLRDPLLNETFERRFATGHPPDEVEFSLLGEAHTVRHHQEKEELLLRLAEDLENPRRQALE